MGKRMEKPNDFITAAPANPGSIDQVRLLSPILPELVNVHVAICGRVVSFMELITQ